MFHLQIFTLYLIMIESKKLRVSVKLREKRAWKYRNSNYITSFNSVYIYWPFILIQVHMASLQGFLIKLSHFQYKAIFI